MTDARSGDGGRDPLRIRLSEEHRARALERELSDVAWLELQRRDGVWEVSVDALGDKLVVRVLNAVSNVLAGDSTAKALVLLNGREYELQGE